MAAKALAGSERKPVRGATATGKAGPNEQLEVSLLLRRGDAAGWRRRVAALDGRDRDKLKQAGGGPIASIVPTGGRRRRRIVEMSQ